MTREDGRMIAERNINPRLYGRLLAKALPGIIETEEENERMLAEVSCEPRTFLPRRRSSST
jgi:hypothetical protein